MGAANAVRLGHAPGVAVIQTRRRVSPGPVARATPLLPWMPIREALNGADLCALPPERSREVAGASIVARMAGLFAGWTTSGHSGRRSGPCEHQGMGRRDNKARVADPGEFPDWGQRPAAFSPGASAWLAVCDGKTVRRWNPRTGQALGKPLTHTHPVGEVVVSLNGRQIITGGEGPITIWDVATEKPIRTLPPGSRQATALVLAQMDGRSSPIKRAMPFPTSNGIYRPVKPARLTIMDCCFPAREALSWAVSLVRTTRLS